MTISSPQQRKRRVFVYEPVYINVSEHLELFLKHSTLRHRFQDAPGSYKSNDIDLWVHPVVYQCFMYVLHLEYKKPSEMDLLPVSGEWTTVAYVNKEIKSLEYRLHHLEFYEEEDSLQYRLLEYELHNLKRCRDVHALIV